jgi:ketopantoate reductase
MKIAVMVMRDLVDECLAVAKADGVTIPVDACDRQADREQVADSSLTLEPSPKTGVES